MHIFDLRLISGSSFEFADSLGKLFSVAYYVGLLFSVAALLSAVGLAFYLVILGGS